MSGGTVTTIESSALLDERQAQASPRAESNPVARKRRMTEQPLSQKTPKTPRRAADPLLAAEQTSESRELAEDSEKQNFLPHEGPEDHQVNCRFSRKPPMHPDPPRKRLEGVSRRDDSARLRQTIHWLEDGARKLREDLALARSELHEVQKAARIAQREVEAAVRETRDSEAAKYRKIIADLRTRLSRSPSRGSVLSENKPSSKAELLREENHRREIMATRKRLAEADEVIKKLRSSSVDREGTRKKRKCPEEGSELYRLECESRSLRETIRRLEEKLQFAVEAEKSRALELQVQYEKHEVEMNALRKTQCSDMIKMMEEIRAKGREIEKLEKFTSRKAKATRDQLMRKLRESERGQTGTAPRIEDTRKNANDQCQGECEASGEAERLRELAVEQQEVIEYLRQALKERERKLDQLLNKKRKEEFYKQWLELEPVAEVDDEEEHEEDSALSSAPTSLSPQPGGWQTNVVTRETYEALLLEVDELQTKYLEEHEELSHAKSQVRDLEKALLQETRGSQNSRRALSEKLREVEERESSLLAEMSELREQNELLEFRVLELEESEPRESPDTADSGIVSPEPIQLFKEPGNRQRDRAVATVIPYNCYSQPLSPVLVQKSPLSLQESGIFEEEDEHEVELASCGTQTETPSGELLQEVQRLQELRERIQERAAKVPVSVEPCENLEDNRVLSYKEKIRELEERLGLLVETDEKRTREQLVMKQREEDLLDENYRLTEQVYWLENERQNICQVKKEFLDAATMTERLHMRDSSMLTDMVVSEYVKSACEVLSPPSRCHEILRSALELCEVAKKCPECPSLHLDYEDKVQYLASAEFCLRRQMLDLECKKGAFAKTLQNVDTTWSQLELDQATKLGEIRCELAETTAINQQMEEKILQLKSQIQEHCRHLVHNSDEVDMISEDIDMLNPGKKSERSSQTDETMDVDDNNSKVTMDPFIQPEKSCEEALKLDTTWRDLAMQHTPKTHEDDRRSGAVSRVCLRQQEMPLDADVTISLSEGEEKVRKRRRKRNERDGWAMRAFYSKNCVKSIANVHRLVLYQEICV